ncbi:BspA family leucine-rich repeat surface protein [Fulvivirga sp.]|uniref:BspA family leucine-rich repeat surface protein n=2 Tax=Fulvivirga sp. TaxID=1931237 RepID=UPI0032EC181E
MKKSLILIVLSLGILQTSFSQEGFRPFITTWNVPGEESFTIPLSNSKTYDFEFHVIQESDTLSSGTHTNADGDFDFFSFQSVTVELHVYGQFPHFANYTKELLLDVNQWGDISWLSMEQSFKDWPGSNFSATDTPDLSNVTSMNRMFQAANAFNADISSWDVSNVKNFGVLFFQAHDFNRDISSWDVSSATNMISMFRDTRAFNQDLSSWDVDSVTNMLEMFMDARAFNGDISQWDIRSVNNFIKFLQGANSFSGPNYDKLLNAWGELASNVGVVTNVKLDANTRVFCLGEEGRNALINDFGWQINDAGKQCSSANDIVSFSPNPFLTIGDVTIDPSKHLVQIYLPIGGDFTNITPQIEVSANAIISPESGEAVDLSSPVTYTVTAFDGTEQEWIVEVLNRPFVTTWEVTSDDETISIPTPSTAFDFQYRWIEEDIVVEEGFHTGGAGDFSTTFPEAGIYQLEILGHFGHFVNYTKESLLDVNQWGDIVWGNMESSFEDWPGEEFSATDAPDLSGVNNMRNMFFGASNFNSPLNHWDVSNVTMMRNLFSGASSFNQDLDNWDVSKVFDFESVFRDATAFNGNVTNWEVNEATTMFLMFSGAENFNQDISDWQPVKVVEMRDMFAFTQAFNQNISQWNVQTVQNMGRMFFDAKGFDQDLSNWNVTGVVNMAFMFEASGLSPQNYDKTLIGWSEKEVQDGVTFGAQGITFCKAAEARQSLIDDHNWTFNDDGNFCSSETNIVFFHSNLENGLGIIKASEGIISLAVPEGTNVSAIASTIKLSPGATISPESGTPVDLNNVVYTVTAEDGVTSQDWTFEFTGPRFITTWVVEGDEGLVIDGSDEGFDYDFEFIIVDANNTVISTGNGTTFQAEFPFEAGEYRVEITGEFPHFAGYPGDQLVDVLQWGDIQWKSMRNSFRNWTGERFSATDVPDLSQVSNMAGLFFNAQTFNGDISDWDVSSVTKMQNTFRDAHAFNQDISSWEVIQVTDMFGMFQNATSFNREVQVWNVGLVTNMREMFRGATLFNQDLGGWNITSVTTMVQMFDNSGLSPQNYDKTLIGWAAQEVKDNVTLGAEGITFCKAAEARQSLIDDHSWVINDVGSFCSSETDILSFTIEGQLGETIIDANNHTVALIMPFETDLSALLANYTISAGAAASIESGAIIDFSSSVIYTITAEDNVTIQDWEISVTEAPNIATDIESVTVTTAIGTEEILIDADSHTVNIRFSFGADITAIPVIFTYSEGATSTIGETGTFDFTNPLVITVIAQDGATSQEWTVSGTIAPNTATDIETVTADVDTEEILIDADSHTVNMRFSFGTDISAVPVIFTYSEGATSSVGEGGTFDFTDPLAITVTAQDGVTSQEWIISGRIAPNTATDILSVIVNVPTDEIVIDNEAHTVDIVFAPNTDLSSVPLEFTLSEGASSDPASGTNFNLTNSAVVTITAGDGVTTQDWAITGISETVLGVEQGEFTWRIYPNPVQDMLHVQSLIEVSAYMTDLKGQTVLNVKQGLEFEFDLSNIPSGFYLLVLKSGEKITDQKILKAH